ncbi:MAG: HTH domain-containing protein [Muribaculaceae bacterium]|nr:HTH domain-containing protein [Muribaculaceae bacterium]
MYAGILLLGHDPQYFIPGAYIQYVKFAGTTRATKVLKENRFKGNLISMLKELEYFIKYSIESKRPEFVSVLREEPRINYPWEAIRELAMNAVMHRAYNGNNSPIKFYEYCDRIEIDNPGNLYGKVNLENFPNETDYRNPNIAEIMLNLGYVNRFGSGVNTVSTLLEENKSNPAEFLLGDYTTFKVGVHNADVIENGTDGTDKTPRIIVNTTESGTDKFEFGTDNGTNESANVTNKGTIVTNDVTNKGTIVTNDVTNDNDIRKEAIIGMMRKNKRVSVTQIAKELNVTRRTIFRIIDTLKSQNRIRRVGDLKSGTWEVIE